MDSETVLDLLTIESVEREAFDDGGHTDNCD